MGRLAVGLYNVPRSQVKAVIQAALEAGVRNFDFASFYDNEAECGAALREWMAAGGNRTELFVSTKVWTTDLVSPSAALRSAEISIKELGLGPVDLLMVHWPVPGQHVEAYLGLEELVRRGEAKSLGISNYSPKDYVELMQRATMAPEVNTFENNPMLYRKDWVDYFHERGLRVEAYKPMQRAGPVLHCGVVAEVARRTGRTAAQVCIRWNLQKGNVVIFKSCDPARIRENTRVFDFRLSKEDMAALDSLTSQATQEEAYRHWEERRSGTSAPWGGGLRPERRQIS